MDIIFGSKEVHHLESTNANAVICPESNETVVLLLGINRVTVKKGPDGWEILHNQNITTQKLPNGHDESFVQDGETPEEICRGLTQGY